jgi:hypothetical protein
MRTGKPRRDLRPIKGTINMGAALAALPIAEDYLPPAGAPDVRAIARELLEQCGDNASALAAMVERAEEDAALYKAIVNGYFRPICAAVIRRAAQESREAAWSAPAAPSTPRLVDMAAWNEAVVEGLLDFRIEGGKRLRDATKPELLASAAAFETRGYDQLIKGRWQRLIANELRDDLTTAGTILSEKRLADLKAEAKKLKGAA